MRSLEDSLPSGGHHKSTVVCLSLPPSLTRQYPSALFTKVRRRNIRKPPWSRVREKEGKKGRIRLIFQLGIETTNRRSLVTVCCPREGAEIDARRPCVTLKEGRERSVDRSFVSLSLSLSNAERGNELSVFFVKCPRANEARPGTSAEKPQHTTRLLSARPSLGPEPAFLSFPITDGRNEWIIDRSQRH